MSTDSQYNLETQITQWRSFLLERQAIEGPDVDELEGHLRDQVVTLCEAGLHDDEAFLVAVKRMGNLDALSREFAKEHSDRLWKQLVLAPEPAPGADGPGRIELFVVIALAVAAGVAIKAPTLFGLELFGETAGFYARNMGLFVLPIQAGYFAWKRRLDRAHVGWLVAMFAAAVVFANVFPFEPGGSTELLTALHLPMALWLVVGFAYVGGEWRSCRRRMDFIRFSGELFIYYSLIALGGGVLTGFTLAMFKYIGLDLEWLAESWILPCGAMGAVIVGGWLVEAKQSVIENMAPVLSRVFTPLFVVMLLAFLATMFLTGRGIDVEREVLIGFDLLLVLVLGLLLYGISAQIRRLPPVFSMHCNWRWWSLH